VEVGRHGAIQIAPVTSRSSGRLRFSIVGYNGSAQPTNLGYENISLNLADGSPVRLYSFDQLSHEARTRATWSRIGLALVAFGQGYYDGKLQRRHPMAAAVQEQNHNDEIDSAEDRVTANLDQTLTNLNGSVLQTTTVDPGMSFGGDVVADEPKLTKGLSQRVDLSVRFGGETYLISFYAAQDGVRPPVEEIEPAALPNGASFVSPRVSAPAPLRSAPAARVQQVAMTSDGAGESSPPSTTAQHTCSAEAKRIARMSKQDCHSLGSYW
jgi:hypothetical protein